MAVYSVEGKLRTGKTKFAIWMAQTALREGLRVASNVDIVLEKITPERRSRYIRIPDKPSEWDLMAMGHGNPDTYDEEKNGVLILDELGTWLNARSFQDKSRGGVIDWLIHSGKLGWHIYLIVQDSNMIDKQVREALIEYQIRVMRMDKVRIPFLGRWMKMIGGVIDPIACKRWGYFPRFHMATSRVGYGANQIIADKWTYRGDDLHVAYDTRQVFTTDYPHGPHSVLPPWDFDPPRRVGFWIFTRLQPSDASLAKSRLAASQRTARKEKLPIIKRIASAVPKDEQWRHAQRLARQGLI